MQHPFPLLFQKTHRSLLAAPQRLDHLFSPLLRFCRKRARSNFSEGPGGFNGVPPYVSHRSRANLVLPLALTVEAAAAMHSSRVHHMSRSCTTSKSAPHSNRSQAHRCLHLACLSRFPILRPVSGAGGFGGDGRGRGPGGFDRQSPPNGNHRHASPGGGRGISPDRGGGGGFDRFSGRRRWDEGDDRDRDGFRGGGRGGGNFGGPGGIRGRGGVGGPGIVRETITVRYQTSSSRYPPTFAPLSPSPIYRRVSGRFHG